MMKHYCLQYFIRDDYDLARVLNEIYVLKQIVSERIICEILGLNKKLLIKYLYIVYSLSNISNSPQLIVLLPQLVGCKSKRQKYCSYIPDTFLRILSQITIKILPQSLPTLKYDFGYIDGTFDHLHQGHKYLLSIASLICNTLTIGIVSDICVSHKLFSTEIQSASIRQENIKEFLNLFKPSLKLIFFEIYDSITGPNSAEFDIIIASSEPGHPLNEINSIRKKNNKPPLRRITVQTVDEGGMKISSNLIRRVIKKNSSVEHKKVALCYERIVEFEKKGI